MSNKKNAEIAIDKNEFVIADTGSFRPSMASLELSYFLLILSIIIMIFMATTTFYSVFSFIPKLYVPYIMFIFIAILSYTAYFLSIESFYAHKNIGIFISIWASIFGFLQALFIFIFVYAPIKSMFPVPWWAAVLPYYHIPVTVEELAFSFVLIVLSSVVYRFIFIVTPSSRIPITATSIVLLFLSLFIVLPGGINLILSITKYFFMLFMLGTIIYVITLFYFLWLNEEDRIIVTNKRIIHIISSTIFKINHIPYDLILNASIKADLVQGNKGYGNVSLLITVIKQNSTERNIIKNSVKLIGVPDPFTFADTVLYFSRRKPEIGNVK